MTPATSTTDTTSYVSVDEIYSGSGKFNTDRVTELYSLVTGVEGAKLSDVYNLISANGGKVSSATIRSKTLGKTSSQDVQVKFGGLTWEVVYLSNDKNGNATMTLWMSNCVQDAFAGRSRTEGLYHGYVATSIGTGLFSDYSSDFHVRKFTVSYPGNMYGTSYVRVVTLNCGGSYSYSASSGDSVTTTLKSYNQSTSSAFAKFTMKSVNDTLIKYITKPVNIAWQETETSIGAANAGMTYTMPNEAYGTPSTTNYYSGTYGSMTSLMSGDSASYYNAWKNDFIWLPSLAETGYNATYDGMWDLSSTQRANFTGANSNSNLQPTYGNAGSSQSHNVGYTDTSWLRTGDYYESADSCAIYPSGNSYGIDFGTWGAQGVRPALHLNLNSIEPVVNVEEIYKGDGNFDSDNMTKLYSYMTGVDGAKISDVKSLLTKNNGKVSSKTLRENADLHDIRVDFGGLNWEVVYLSNDRSGNPTLTLWLSNNVQAAFAGRKYNEGYYHGYITSSIGTGLYSKYDNHSDTNYSTFMPSGIYGTSYIRAATLNNGGLYRVNSSGTTREMPQLASSAFAKFTMANVEDSLVRYITTPSQVAWQEDENPTIAEYAGSTYMYPNDAYGTPASGPGTWYDTDVAKAPNAINYDIWKYDYLWLPSFSETGYTRTYDGIWDLDIFQRQNFDTYSLGSQGTALGVADGGAFPSYWLRSGGSGNAGYAMTLEVDGWNKFGDPTNSHEAVRPALHLNLSEIDKDTVESSVYVDEIYDGDGKTNGENLTSLFEYLTGKGGAKLSDVESLIMSKGGEVSSATIRSKTYNKTSTQDVQVKFGGLVWNVVYLSNDRDGNPTLTLWLSNNIQDAFAGRAQNEGTYYGYYETPVGTGLFGSYSANLAGLYYNVDYPPNAYGTSYLRAVTLNNGGIFSKTTTSYLTATQSASSVFAKFTMDSVSDSLTKFITKPIQVAWQETETSIGTGNAGSEFTYPNEAYGTPSVINWADPYDYNPHEISSVLNAVNYDIWKNDYLWLPSAAETGRKVEILCDGFWDLSISQRKNYDGTTNGLPGSHGVNYDSWAHTITRSGNCRDANSTYSVSPNGIDIGYSGLKLYHAIRPALHLNLRELVECSRYQNFDVEDGNIFIDKSEVIYNGNTQSVAAIVSHNGINLSIGDAADVSIKYFNEAGVEVAQMVDIGTYTIKAIGNNIRNANGISYSGEISTTFVIRYDIASNIFNKMTISRLGDCYYTGSAVEPELEIKYQDTTLINGIDYVLGYYNNTTLGTATVNIIGKGKFTGYISMNFEIIPKFVAQYDNANGYWYVEVGRTPQKRVGGLLNAKLNAATLTLSGNSYKVSRTLTLNGYMYQGQEYCVYNNQWYHVDPIRWRLEGTYTEGEYVDVAQRAILSSIVYFSEYSTTGSIYDISVVDAFFDSLSHSDENVNNLSTFIVSDLPEQNSKMYIASESEIGEIAGTYAVEFSDLVFDILHERFYYTRTPANDGNIRVYHGIADELASASAPGYQHGIQFVVNISGFYPA